MRWPKKEKEYPNTGDTRVVEKFLLFPKCLHKGKSYNATLEYRWLEKASIVQEYCGGIYDIPASWEDDHWFN